MNKHKLLCIILLLSTSFIAQANDRTIISTTNAPKAVGPYSQAVKSGNMLFVAGQLAIDPATGKLIQGDIKAQTRQALRNVQSILEAAGFKLTDVVQSQVYLSDLNEAKEMNAVYATFFKQQPPARSLVQSAKLPLSAKIEIMVTAKH